MYDKYIHCEMHFTEGPWVLGYRGTRFLLTNQEAFSKMTIPQLPYVIKKDNAQFHLKIIV